MGGSDGGMSGSDGGMRRGDGGMRGSDGGMRGGDGGMRSGPDATSDGDCGCRLSATGKGMAWGPLGLAALLLVVFARRRRH